MINTPELHVAPVTAALADAVRALRVADHQRGYIGDIEVDLDGALDDPRSDAMAVMVEGRVIGFYRLDYLPSFLGRNRDASATTDYCVGLRALLIDHGMQGRGHGSRAILACCADLQRRHPRRRLLSLSVDCRHVSAIRLYRRAGFVDTGELYRGGRGGPQHLMVRALGPLGARNIVGQSAP